MAIMKCTGGVGEAQLQVLYKSVVGNFVILQQQLLQSYALTDIANAVTLCNHAHCEMVICLVLLSVECHCLCATRLINDC